VPFATWIMISYFASIPKELDEAALIDGAWLRLDGVGIESRDPANPDRVIWSGAPRVPQSFLAARRLVEAGARVVTVNYSKWDWHGGKGNDIFTREREDFPIFDQAITALVEDLHQRGMDKDTTVLVWGEFGRTPRISAQVGRDHWPRVGMALMAGGGMRCGQVIGSTDRHGGEANSRPVTFQEVFATLYHNLGIDVNTTTIMDAKGRPYYLVDNGAQPIRELV